MLLNTENFIQSLENGKKYRKVKILINPEGEKWRQIHEGFVLEETVSFAKVFNPKKEGGDVSPETSCFYPKNGKCSKIVDF